MASSYATHEKFGSWRSRDSATVSDLQVRLSVVSGWGQRSGDPPTLENVQAVGWAPPPKAQKAPAAQSVLGEQGSGEPRITGGRVQVSAAGSGDTTTHMRIFAQKAELQDTGLSCQGGASSNKGHLRLQVHVGTDDDIL